MVEVQIEEAFSNAGIVHKRRFSESMTKSTPKSTTARKRGRPRAPIRSSRDFAAPVPIAPTSQKGRMTSRFSAPEAVSRSESTYPDPRYYEQFSSSSLPNHHALQFQPSYHSTSQSSQLESGSADRSAPIISSPPFESSSIVAEAHRDLAPDWFEDEAGRYPRHPRSLLEEALQSQNFRHSLITKPQVQHAYSASVQPYHAAHESTQRHQAAHNHRSSSDAGFFDAHSFDSSPTLDSFSSDHVALGTSTSRIAFSVHGHTYSRYR
jgi:hypothetical protein